MQRHLDAGVSAAQAAQLALAETSPRTPPTSCSPRGSRTVAGQLRAALDRLDEPAQRRASIACSRRSRSRRCCVTSSWRTCASSASGGSAGDASIAQEHFASNLLRGRLLGPRARLGPRLGPDDAARLRARRAARPPAHRLRSRARRSRLGDRVPRARHAHRDDRDASATVEPDLVVISAVGDASVCAPPRRS